MRPPTSLYCILFSLTGIFAQSNDSYPSFQETCQAISAVSPAYYPTSKIYINDTTHWLLSSSQSSACSVEPGSPADVGKILQIIGSTRTPFAVKGGGHTSNPGFSSTPGVQISMSRFNDVTYDAASQTANIGAGLIWDDVYAALEQYNVSAVGGRVSGVGVAGFTLGGGFSWKTNQYGLTLDTVQAYELVLPNGTVKTVTAADEDLFFGLRGGYNNLGIVTQFTLKTFPQTEVWGGPMNIAEEHFDQLARAIADFAEHVTDPKAEFIPTYNYGNGTITNQVLLFYDGPTPPAGMFDALLAVPFISKDISTRSYLSLVQSPPGLSDAAQGQRGTNTVISLFNVTPRMISATVNETKFWGAKLANLTENFVSYDIEPFLPSIFSHSTAPSAYPPDRSRGLLPLNIFYGWQSEEFDETMHDAIEQSARALMQAAIADGQNVTDAAIYPNYAEGDTPIERIYGDHVERLKRIKEAVDPQNVMSLAGGFKF